jgi:hypothetical protein
MVGIFGRRGLALACIAWATGCASNSDSTGDRRGANSAASPVQPADDGAAGATGAAPTEAAEIDFGNTSGEAAVPPERPTVPMTPDEGLTETEICVQDNAEATLQLRPIDIIISIDTSGSMSREIYGVQQNINENFARIIGDSGIDYQVIVISDDDVCISGELNPGGCGQSNPPQFHWIERRIGSDDTWCVVLASYPQWSGLLRQEAFKVFVAVTDDSPRCNGMYATQEGADAFDAALVALDPTQFGNATERNYIWHSLVALADNTPATEAYQPTDPVVIAECATAASAGMGYQHLSQMTGGLRFPVCEGNNFDSVFTEIAEGIVDGSAVACEFAIPATGDGGEAIDRDTVEVAYVPGDRQSTVKFDRVEGMADCATEAFLVDGDLVKLCPSACDALKQDHEAEIQVLFGCEVCGGLDIDCGTTPPQELPPLE